MGLCKCPRKKVTNQFCFEHKVNVCEHCMISSHEKCIIGPYLRWLDDSSFEPVCTLCHDNLSSQECIRLLCYHIFHTNCLNQYATNLPSNTAPAGYSCPTCARPIFPQSSTSSPVAASLQKTLADVSWARIGLGMPLIDSPNASYSSLNDTSLSNSMNQHNVPQVIHNNPPPTSNAPIAVNNINNFIVSNDSNFGLTSISTTRVKSHENENRNSLHDIDEDKYRNKSPMEFISRWLRSHSTFINRGKVSPALTYRRWFIAGILLFLIVCTLVHYFLKMGRESAENDPMLDPRFNPNIRNEEIER